MKLLIALGVAALVLGVLLLYGWIASLEDEGRIGRAGRVLLAPVKVLGRVAFMAAFVALVVGFVGILYAMGHG